MNQSGQGAAQATASLRDLAPGPTLAVLRERGADRLDPVRFRFIEALARRTATRQGAARGSLDGKLAKVLNEYIERFEQAKGAAGETLARAVKRYPDTAADLGRAYDAGDFRELRRCVGALEGRHSRSPLADLLAYIDRQAQDSPDGALLHGSGQSVETRGELKSVTYFRSTWSQLSADQQLSRALAQAPQNAGPLNSHLLVVHALQLMREISPDYLKCFMSYVDTLLWLDQADDASKAEQKNAGRGERDKKRKPGRGNAG